MNKLSMAYLWFKHDLPQYAFSVIIPSESTCCLCGTF